MSKVVGRDELEQTGLNAPLPSDFRYGEDAMEQVALGRKLATLAICELLWPNETEDHG